jgi:1,4-alpha-glucan branching enzyme
VRGGEAPPAGREPWWKTAVFYQIYPRSFADSDGDGVGDLAGIRSHLADLAWLGVDALWISPFYPSPMVDFGYDISNYCDVDPRFGTLDDFDALIEDAHSLGLRVIIDWVPNHTSDQHPWFIDALAGRETPALTGPHRTTGLQRSISRRRRGPSTTHRGSGSSISSNRPSPT